MIVCHCHGVSERVIRESIQRGARSQREVALACGAGRGCGGCHPVVAGVIADECGDPAGAVAPRLAATG